MSRENNLSFKIILLIKSTVILFSSLSFAYNRNDAVDDAIQYGKQWNTKYNFYGNPSTGKGADCANFVSQLLRKGCYREKLVNSPYIDDRECIKLCDDLHKFLIDNAEYTEMDILFSSIPPNNLEVGDVVIFGYQNKKQEDGTYYFDTKDKYTHAVVITSITKDTEGNIRNILYSGHTSNRVNAELYKDGNWKFVSTSPVPSNPRYPDRVRLLNFYHVKPSPSNGPHPELEGQGRIIPPGKDASAGHPIMNAPPINITVARDPNAKYGQQGYVSAGETLNYTVEFENEGEGIAYGVYVTDVLDKNLDDSYLTVDGFKRIDADKRESPANFVYRYNPQTRMLTVFIDRDGEVFSKEGGKFSLSVKVKSDAQPGAVITNYATVYFPSVPEVTPTNPIVSVIPVQTQLTYLGDLSVKQSQVAELKAVLTTLDGKKVPAKTVTFFIDGSSYTTTTDMEGVATLYPTAEQTPGKYTITANFAGDGFYYLPSSDAKPFEIIAVDTTPPVITLISPLGGEKFIATISTITINYTVTDDLDPSPTSYVYLTDLEEGTTIQLFNNQTIKPLDIDDGFWTLTVEAKDSAGNFTSSTTAKFEVIHDLQPPRSQLQVTGDKFQVEDKTYITSTTYLSITAVDDLLEIGDGKGLGVKEIRYRVLGATDTPFTVYRELFMLYPPDGEKIIEYYSVDNLGNREKPKTEKLTLDNTPPVAQLLSPSPESIGLCQIFKGTIPIIGSVDDLHLKLYQIEVTTDVFLTSSFVTIKESASPATEQILTTWDTTQLIAGYYTLKLTARDLVENQTVTQVKLYIGEPQFLTSFGKHGKPKKKDDKEPFFNQPQGIALDTTNKLIYIADTNNDLIQKLDLSGNVLEIWGDKGEEDDRNNKGDKGDKGELELNKPHGLALDKEGNLYVADTNNQRVIKLNPQGELLLEISKIDKKDETKPGKKEGEFNHPTDIALDKEGNIYVVDRNNERIQKFDSLGNFLLEIITEKNKDKKDKEEKSGEGTYLLNKPYGIAVDKEGNIYVSDWNNDRVLKFNPQGEIIFVLGEKGKEPGQFHKPAGLFVNELGYLYVCDQENNRVQKFDPYGNLVLWFSETPPRRWGEKGKKESELHQPTDIAFDSQGNAYIVDTKNQRIEKFGLPGQVNTVVSAPSLTHSSLPTDFVLGEYYSFPNPAKNGRNPTIHFECGIADKVEIRIYDIAGELVHSVTVNGEPLPVNGRYAYEYTWDISDVASGVYIYCIQAKKSGYLDIKVRKKLAVIK